MELEELKAYLRVDITDDDDLIQSLQTSAEIYFENAGVIKNYSNELYTLAVKILVANWYENRSINISGEKNLKVPFGLDNIINQLYYSQT